MATFLALAQKVANESNTLDDGVLTTVVGQTGRKGKIVRWTNDAYKIIQNAHRSWLWLQGEFYGSLVDGTQRYAYTAFNDFVTAAAISRFRDWKFSREGDSGFSIYDNSVGVAEEMPLLFRSWDWCYLTQLRGTQTESRPSIFTVTPDRKLAFFDTPDSNDYRVRGRYWKSPQDLADDADEPEMPSEHHDVIVDVAMLLVDAHDESPQFQLHQLRKLGSFSALERDQLPTVLVGAPLA